MNRPTKSQLPPIKREPSGVPVGGQFAAAVHTETDMQLGTPNDGATEDTSMFALGYGRNDPEQIPDIPDVLISTGTAHADNGVETDWAAVWTPEDIECECSGSNGEKVWKHDDKPRIWDTSGTGTLTVLTTNQCGHCGSQIGPPVKLLTGDAARDDTQINEAAQATAEQSETARSSASNKAEIATRNELNEALQQYAAGADIENITTGSEEHPGVWFHDGLIEAWRYDPADQSTPIVCTAEAPDHG